MVLSCAFVRLIPVGEPVAFVSTSALGVPRAGVVSVGLLNVPPVMVLPVKVRAEGIDSVGVVVPVTVISFAVPVTLVTPPLLMVCQVLSPRR